ncbi:hypothetical protein J6590_086521 [Homalodisca vitripennis]|nr:hypothetical protein J6590_086521 [Homalodisca vitripennis]
MKADNYLRAHLETSVQVLQCEYDDPWSTPRQKKPVSRAVRPRPGPCTHCPPLKNKVSSMGPVSSMALSSVSEEEVAHMIQGLKPKTSCDINGMSLWLLKRCSKHILAPLTNLINLSFPKDIFPSLLKSAKVTAFLKKTILALQATIVQFQSTQS